MTHRIGNADRGGFRPLLWLALAALALGGCAWWSGVSEERWPGDLPPREAFVERYRADALNRKQQSLTQYLLGIKRFYEGWRLYQRGWNDLVPEVLASVDSPEQRRELEQRLHRLGMDIASEWAKTREAGKIETRHLSVWGNAMRDAMARGDTCRMVDRIGRDVDRILNNRLKVSEISADRYYQQDENDVFR